MTEVLVAGGGIIGLSCGWRLSQRGFRVTLCEKGDIGGEATWAAAGMLAPGGEFTCPSTEAKLGIESRAMYPDFVRELEQASGDSIDFQENGGLDLAFSEGDVEQLEQRAAQQATLGITGKYVSTQQAAQFWPRLNKAVQAARFYAGDAVVDPRDLTRALACACRRCGVLIHEHCAISSLEVKGSSVAALGKHYDYAVIAAGAWSSSINFSGVPPVPACEPVKGQMIGYSQPAQTCPTILRQGHLYMLQRAGGLLIAGASMEHAGFDRSVSPQVTRELATWAGTVLPHLAETAPEEVWTGLRPAAACLQLGKWHSDRVLLAYGHYRNGILLAPITAHRICSELT